METKKVLKNIGKGLLTLVSPPIGLMTFAKNAKERTIATLAGMVFSAMSAITMEVASDRELYDTPAVHIRTRANSIAFIPELLASPLAFYFDRSLQTVIESGNEKHYAIGDNIIIYNTQIGKYELNFDENTRFHATGVLNLANHYISLKNIRDDLEKLTAEGNVVEARKASTKLEEVSKDYGKVRAVYQSTVDKMNSELVIFAKKKEENK